MYIHYSTGNNSGPRTLVRIVEVSVIGGVHFRRFHCNTLRTSEKRTPLNSEQWTLIRPRRTLANTKLPPKTDSEATPT